MNILGLHLGHDSAAAVVKNGRLVSMIEKERLSGIKYDRGYSQNMVDYVLCLADLELKDIDCVAVSIPSGMNEIPQVRKTDIEGITLRKDGRPYINGPRQLDPWDYEEFDVEIQGLKFKGYQVQHHIAHIASSYYLSNYDNAMGLSYDASYWPENQTSYICNCNHNRIEPIACPNLNGGILYDQITRCLFGNWRFAGKTMGLAAYGKSVLKEYQPRDINLTMMLLSDLVHACDQQQLAASAQHWLQKDVSRVLDNIHSQNLVISGGTALNVVVNRMIYDRFPNTFIAPFPKDSGISAGGALYVAHHIHNLPRQPYKNYEIAFLGGGNSWKNTGIESAAEVLKHNGILLWHQGRSEVGPRALTHRSILARADNAELKKTVSIKLKGREWFRPLAPIVRAEDCSKYFDVEASPLTDFMLLNAKVKVSFEGITHVDDTARVQTVSRKFNPVIWELLGEFPVLINTSLNIGGKPIAEMERDTLDILDNGLVSAAWINGRMERK